MWHLPKPDLQETLSDVDLFERLGIITSAENPILKQLVWDYDNQNADLTPLQLSTIQSSTADKIYSNYEQTYKNRNLFSIRWDLSNTVYHCPYCGISEPGTLDHYMSKSTYKALALCRLNLVPMCSCCNQSKSKSLYSDFFNPYYLVNPGVEFFICTINFRENDVVYIFSVKAGVFDEQQTLALNSQIDKIGLNDRWEKAVISYLQEDIFDQKDTPQSLIESLPSLIEKKTTPKWTNHWKTAVLRGLKQVINEDPAIAKKILDAVNNKEYY